MIVSIDQDACKACGICGQVCPRHIPVTADNNGKKITMISSERIDLCIECGHCTAVCPNQAIQIKCFNEEDFAPLEKLDIDDHQFLLLMKQRRSVRRYKDKPVPRETIDRIIDAVHVAPTGTGRMTTGVIVIDNPKTLATLSELAYGLYEGLEKNLKNPIARFFIRRQVGEKKVRMLQDFVMPGMHWYIRWYREGKSNEILRDCPALMLFHSPIYEPVSAENCLIAAFHAIMMAQVMGIGTCFNDLIPPACNRVPEIRNLLGILDDREVYASITMGYPKYQFKRIPLRKLAEARYL
ncbi:nitroreductase family protein [candidate division KSB1 bacterium]|nr:nitroreductase family protein [candidate division KSB1 bacterium]